MLNCIKKNNWIWIDIEMTGLNERKYSILQIAMIITNSSCVEIASENIIIWQPKNVLAKISPFVRKLHEQNGLLKLVKNSTISISGAEEKLMKTITKYVDYKKGILVGNTIYVDRKFLKIHMPSLESYLHYKQIDISSLQIVCNQWHEKRKKVKKNISKHIAIDDIRQSIMELKYYKNNYFN
jgi:oligoribonuclease